MTEFFITVEEQRQRLAREKADKNIAVYYYQKGAGEHYRLTRYESGREVIETFGNQDD